MTRWPTAKHFASWLGLSPNNRVTGGKVISSRTKPSANRAAKALRLAANALRLAANALYRSHSALGAFLRRKKAQLGAPKAITATAHKLARIIYAMLRYGQQYVDAGAEYYESQYHERALKERCGQQKGGRRSWATNWSRYPIAQPRPLICPWQQPRPARENLSYSIVNRKIGRVKAVKFGSGILGIEPPVDGGSGGVALRDQSIDFPSEGHFAGEPLLQAGAGQDAELNLGHVQPTPVLGV